LENETEKIMIELLREIKQEQQKINQRLDKLDKRFDEMDENLSYIAGELGKLCMNTIIPTMSEPKPTTKKQVNKQMPDENLKNVVLEINSLEELWNTVLAQIEQRVSKPSFETWMKSTKLFSYNGSTLSISAPNVFARDWLDNHYIHLFKVVLKEITGEDLLVEFIVQKNLDSDDFPVSVTNS